MAFWVVNAMKSLSIQIQAILKNNIVQHTILLLHIHAESANQVLAQVLTHLKLAATQGTLTPVVTQEILTAAVIREVLIINNVNAKVAIIEIIIMVNALHLGSALIIIQTNTGNKVRFV
uniref:Uncharacterized protein n=1 Tax=Acrobeloides nanus TaxID=290746 RepID=A0A914CNW6_9BILA